MSSMENDESGTPPSEMPEPADQAIGGEGSPEPLSGPSDAPPPSEEFGWWPYESPPPPPTPPPTRRRRSLAAILAALVLLSGGIGIGWGLSGRGDTKGSTTDQPLNIQPQTSPSNAASGVGLDLQAIANLVDPGVVNVTTVIGAVGDGLPRGQAAGTGMIVTPSGDVLTNNHVIAGATSISVTIQGHSGRYGATVLGVDPTDDVALLHIQGVSGLSPVSFADSSSLTVGQRVVAIGNALGRGGAPTVTEGVVEAVGRSITVSDDQGGAEHLTNLIQAQVQISPGDSGGALVNGYGQVVGMITAGQGTRTHRISQVAYAIPVNTAVKIANEIQAGHSSSLIIIGQTGFLGVQVQEVDAQSAARLGASSGALVVGIVPGTPAASAGIPSDAVITAIDGEAIHSLEELGPAIYLHKPGEQIRVTWSDQSGLHTVTVTLIAGPAV